MDNLDLQKFHSQQISSYQLDTGTSDTLHSDGSPNKHRPDKERNPSEMNATHLMFPPQMFQYQQEYMKKRNKNKKSIKMFVQEVLDKNKWKEKFKEIKTFMKKDDSKKSHPEKQNVFRIVLALYGGDEEEEVFDELQYMYARYPQEIEFYIPQLCTYLFHFGNNDHHSYRGSSIHPVKHQQFQKEIEEEKEQEDSQRSSQQKKLENFLIERSRKSLRFAHLIFWYLIAGLDDSESIQMAQHKNPLIWSFLNTLICLWDDRSLLPPPSQSQKEFKLRNETNEKLLSNIIEMPRKADTGSSQLNFSEPEGSLLDNHAFLTRYDQQIIRTLANNQLNHQNFLHTPKFVSDLLFISDNLKGVSPIARNQHLSQLLAEINLNLPPNIYVPINQENIFEVKKRSSKIQNLKKRFQFSSTDIQRQLKSIREEKKSQPKMHRVLRVSTDHAFCLHSKERVPYHIIIEVEYLDDHESPSKQADAGFQSQDEEVKPFDELKEDRGLAQSHSKHTLLSSSEVEMRNLPKKEKPNLTEQRNFSGDEIHDHAFEFRFGDESSSRKARSDDRDQNKKSLLQTKLKKQFKMEISEEEKHEKAEDKDAFNKLKKLSLIANKFVGQEYNYLSERTNNSSSEYNSGTDNKVDAHNDINSGDQSDQEEDEFFYFDGRKSNFMKKCCQCWNSRNNESEIQGDIKHCGLFGSKTYNEVCSDLRHKSPYSHLPNFGLISLIVKSGDDLRQEQFAAQLISKFKDIFALKGLDLWLKHFNIIATCNDGGLIQTVPDAVSIDKIKKVYPFLTDLREYFIFLFGKKKTSGKKKCLIEARKAFVHSMAGYSLLCYILQIKDRHNGNILLDGKGHVIHVDFGFMLSNSPGNMNFEAAPFKLTKEYVDVMGGQRSKGFAKFQNLMVKGFLALREHAEEIISFIEMTMISGIDLPCFSGDRVLEQLRGRFRQDLSSKDCKQFMLDMIYKSTDNWRTRWYDKYQRYTVGIL